MNKNDLRFQKTETSIREAYIALKKRGVGAVKVVDLCEAAMINKTTFYAHYETIDHLHKTICNEFLSEVLATSRGLEIFMVDLKGAMYAILEQFTGRMSYIKMLYGENLYEFVNDFERLFIKAVLENNKGEDFEFALRFCIGGAFRLLLTETDPVRLEKIFTLTESILLEAT